MSRIVEIFVDIIIDGKKTIYMVSDDGRVMNRNTGQILKPKLNKDGYLELRLQLPGGGKTTKRIHRLVAKAFIPNPFNKPTVNHKNIHNLSPEENRQDNCVENLEWATYKEQYDHALSQNFIIYDLIGEKNPNSKYDQFKIHEICKMLEEDKIPQREIARITNTNIGVVHGIRMGRMWTHISSQYNISNHSKLQYYDNELKLKIRSLLNQGNNRYDIISTLGLPNTQASYSLIGNVKQAMRKEGSTTIENDEYYEININL